MAGTPSQTDLIREFVRRHYFDPARKRGQSGTRIIAGDVHSALGLRNRVPMVCNALRSQELLRDAGVRILKESGPPSGQSTTVEITYEFLPGLNVTVSPRGLKDPEFLKLRGIAKETFRALGGGEKYIAQQRRRFLGRGGSK